MLYYRADTEDELSQLHADLEGMSEIAQDDADPYEHFDQAIELIQEVGKEYPLTGSVAYAIGCVIANRD